MYKILNFMPGTNIVYRLSDNLSIPMDENNNDYQTYLRWLDGYEKQEDGSWKKTSEGNTPLLADE